MFGDKAAMEHVNARLRADASFDGQQFAALDMSAAGGFKAISAEVYAASFNYGDIEDLRGYLETAPWRIPRSVTVIWDGETGDGRIFPGATEVP